MPGRISEIDVVGGVGNEFIEIAIPAGTDVSGYSICVYAANGSIVQAGLSLGAVQNTVAGEDVYVVDHATGGLGDIAWSQAIALVDDTGTVVQFVSFSDGATHAKGGGAAPTAVASPGRRACGLRQTILGRPL